jgi:hypothetical protein
MLLHVTAVHSENNCPAYHQEKLAGMMQSLEKREDLARQFNIRLHYMVSAAPEHSFYALLETENFPSVSRFLMEMLPLPHDFKITVVQSAEDLVSAWKPVAQA